MYSTSPALLNLTNPKVVFSFLKVKTPSVLVNIPLGKSIKSKSFKKVDEIYQENISADFSHAEDICYGLYRLITTKKNPDKLIFSSNTKTYINDLINFL